MSAAESEVMDAIQDLSETFETKIAGLPTRTQMEEIERKLNLLQVTRGGGRSADGIDHAELFTKSLAAWFPNRAPVRVDYPQYKAAFQRYMRYGRDVLSGEELKSLSVGVDSEGGYLAPSEYSNTILRVEQTTSVMRRVARVLPVGAEVFEQPASLTNPACSWVGETQARGVTDPGKFGMLTLTPRELYAAPAATQKLLDDSAFDVEAFLGGVVGEAFGIEEDKQFLQGDGVVKPHGITSYPTAATTDAAGTRAWGTLEHVATGSSGAWPTNDYDTYDLLVKVTQSLKPGYRSGAVWLMGTESVTKMMQLKDSNKQPLWQRSMVAGTPPLLLGYPVYEAEQLPAIAANSLSVAFGNFQRGYWVSDRTGIRVLRDPFTSKPYVIFYTTRRTGGNLADSLAIKLIKFAAA